MEKKMTDSTFSIMRLKRKGKDEDISIPSEQIILQCESSKLKDYNKENLDIALRLYELLTMNLSSHLS